MVMWSDDVRRWCGGEAGMCAATSTRFLHAVSYRSTRVSPLKATHVLSVGHQGLEGMLETMAMRIEVWRGT